VRVQAPRASPLGTRRILEFAEAPDQSVWARDNLARAAVGRCAPSTVTAITKCLIQMQAVNGLTVTPRALNHHGRTGDWIGPFAGWWRVIMTKTSDDLRELRDDEVDGVSGGLVVISIIGILIGQLLPPVNPPPEPAKAP
jgi:hypothetical protein